MSIKLVAIDMDGTTFDNKGQISELNIEAICRACRMGIFIVPATGRSFYELPRQIYEIEEIQYFVVSNGAVVCNRDGIPLYTNEIPFDSAAEILDILEQYDVMKELYIAGRPMAEQAKLSEASFRYYNIDPKYFSVLLEARQPIESAAGYLHQKQYAVEKLNLFFKSLSQRSGFIEKMGTFAEAVELTSSMDNNVEINKRGANKGAGLAALCSKLHIPAQKVLAMGDSDNDITMLRYAGTGVAVSNACNALKQAADFITCSNDENAVAEVLKNFVFPT